MRRLSRIVTPFFAFVGAFVALAVSGSSAFAQDAAAAGGGDKGLLGIGAALAVALAAFGGALGQGKAAAAGLEGISRNPQASGKIFIPMIVALAFIESLVIYGLIIAFSLAGKA
jgi:F-type H+-transporting ATPase subunit c